MLLDRAARQPAKTSRDSQEEIKAQPGSARRPAELGFLDGPMSGNLLDGIPLSGNPLDQNSIGALIQSPSPLIEEYLSLEQQLQPNGFDLTLREVGRFVSAGSIGSGPGGRELSDTETVSFGHDDWIQLEPGPYLVTYNEVVNLPRDLMALGRPRSSLLRSGVSVHTAVWDAGYCGRSQSLMVVHQGSGYRLQRGARLMQLIFFRLPRAAGRGYQGRFQGENLA